MKRIIALILVAVLCFGMMSLTTAAKDSLPIAESLKKVIEERDPEEQIFVVVWVQSDVKPIDRMPSWPDWDKAKEEMKAIIASDIRSFLDSIPEDIEYESDSLMLTPMAFLQIKVKDAERIAASDKVIIIDYLPSDDEMIDPPVPWEEESTIEERFKLWMWKQDIVEYKDGSSIQLQYQDYKELVHTDDWSLVQAHVMSFQPWEYVESRFFGDTIISWWNSGVCEYPYGLFVYDASKKTFSPIEEVQPEAYNGLLESIKALKLGRPLGDADGDKDLSILDATAIQRHIADLKILPENDCYELTFDKKWKYADADRSGDVTILDATAIQRHLAGLV